MRSNRVLKLAIACTLASVASTAVAQEKSGEPTFEVIVTAQKREQNLQDVPVVVTAVSEQLLHDTGVKDIKDLTVLTPGLLVTSSSSEVSTTARIRGIGTVGDNPGLESSVGIVIDGVYRPRNGVSFGDLGEMERIEVLKGPQGTLFGKNTTAGVINVVSKKPTFTPSSKAEMTFGNYNDLELAASVNGPLSDAVAGRLYAAVRKRDGFLDITTNGGQRLEDDDGNRSFYTLRGQLLFNINEDVELRLVGDYTDRDEYCCAAVQVVHGSAGVPVNVNRAAGSTNAVAVTPDPYARRAYANRATTTLLTEQGLSAEINWDIDETQLTSITAWRDWESTRAQDSDYTTADLLYRLANGDVFTRFQQFSQEIRLAGQSGPVNWLGGIFYAKERLNAGDSLRPGANLGAYTSWTATGGATGSVLPALGITAPLSGGNKDRYEQVAENFSIFTNNSIEITEGLEFTIGARMTSESKKLDTSYWNNDSTARTACAQARANQTAIAGALGAGAAAVFGYICNAAWDPNFDAVNTTQSMDESKFTGTGKLAYRFNENAMTYASYARGYKAGGFNLDRTRNQATQAQILTTSFLPETVDSYELGNKLTLMNGALLVNAAAFLQNYQDFQFNTFTGIAFVVTNLKEVESKGVDLDVIYQTNFGLGIQGGATYSRTDIIDFGAGGGVGLISDLRESNRMPFAPDWTGSLALSYKTTVGDFALGGNVGAKYNSEYNTGSNLDPRKLQEAYTVLNARLSVGAADDKWAIEFWSQNLTDEEYAQVMFDATIQGSASTRSAAGAVILPTSTVDAFLGAPRTYGATLIVKF